MTDRPNQDEPAAPDLLGNEPPLGVAPQAAPAVVRDAIEALQTQYDPGTVGEERVLKAADAGTVYAGLTGPTGVTGPVGVSPTGPGGPTGVRGPTGP